jgi:hypothetical protein
MNRGLIRFVLVLFCKMEVFLHVSGQQNGPFSLSNVHDMKQLGSIPGDALAWCQGEPNWLPLKDFLTRHPINPPRQAAVRRPKESKSPSRLRGLAGALLASFVGGALLAGFAALTGVLFSIMWWGLAWGTGTAAKSWARKNDDQVVGLFALGATLIGIVISTAGFEIRPNSKMVLGGLAAFSFFGSLWFAFRTGSTA